MKATHTFGVHFVLRMSRKNNGQAPIYARITVDRRRVEISMKKYIDPTNWNTDKGVAKGSREEIRSLNHFLEQVKAKLLRCYQEMRVQDRLITAEAIKNRFLGTDESHHTLWELVEYHNTDMKDTLTPGTMKNYYTTQRYIKKFLKAQYKTSDIPLRQLTFKFIIDFEYFLRKHKPVDHQRALSNNGVMKHIERLRKMIGVAIRMEWIDKDPFAAYKLKFDKVEREFLTQEELTEIEQRDFGVARLEWVRDLFVFSCYTGLAYIDVMRLTPTNVGIGIDGESWLTTKRQKTRNPVRIPLLPKALEIIGKYKDNPRALANGTLFPVLSNQKLNSYLKEMADLCGIHKNLTFHLARHTFATTVTLTNGVPIESVSKMLGHSAITTTQIYAKVIERKLSEDMKVLKEKLFNI